MIVITDLTVLKSKVSVTTFFFNLLYTIFMFSLISVCLSAEKNVST